MWEANLGLMQKDRATKQIMTLFTLFLVDAMCNGF